VLGPRLTVAATDPAPLALAQTLAAPRVDRGPVQAPRPVEVAVATPPPPAPGAARAAQPADPAEAAASFVQTYAAVTAKRAIARWVRSICVKVVGLPDEQAATVKARIEAVAKGVGVKSQPSACASANVEVDFTTEGQKAVDDLFKAGGEALSDPTSGTQSVKSMTLPIQAWYLTNGTDLAANDTGDLKALADYRTDGSASLKTPVLYQWYPGPGQPTPSSNIGVGQGSYSGYNPAPSVPFGGWAGRTDPALRDKSRQLLNVFVIVDAKRIPHAQLGSVADYVAMLALAQPRSLGECQALPSITDLFAACPDRAAPEGLTTADLAYLHALYAADHTIWAVGRTAVAADVTKAMASRLAGEARLAAR
jgi:hypothetical protein